MLLATANGRPAGERFRAAQTDGPLTVKVEGTVRSEHPLALLEVVANGQVVCTLAPQNQMADTGAHESPFSTEVGLATSGWLCVRAFEDRPDGRVRFAHTAPWWVEMDGRPWQLRPEEKDYLVRRVKEEIARSRDVLPPSALAEYEAALARFERLSSSNPAP
jgi:hypothetical protein